MPFKRRTGTVTAVGATTTLGIGLGAPFGKVTGYRISKTGDAATRVQIADADGRIVYLDAADADYTTVKDRVITPDDTVTGLTGGLPIDATGAAFSAAQQASTVAVCKSPLTLTFSNGTAADVWTVNLYVEV